MAAVGVRVSKCSTRGEIDQPLEIEREGPTLARLVREIRAALL